MTKYTEEDKEVVRLLLEQGLNVAQVSAETEIPEGTISGWKQLWRIRHKKSYSELYKGTVEEVQERLIKIMQEAPEISYNYFNSAESNVPPATTYRKYFGSWTAALQAAGVVPTTSKNGIICSQKIDRKTLLYLVKFEDFYKIGTTQQTITQRLGGRYPPYTIIKIKEFGELTQAKLNERKVLELVKECKYIPPNFPAEGRGFTECFKPTEELLESILSIFEE